MSQKPTIFLVTDIETTFKRIAFDVAWIAIDRQEREYARGSYLITNAFRDDTPYYKSKMGFYFEDTYKHLVEPISMFKLRNIYNEQVNELREQGYKIIFCAYNAGFDSRYLGETCWRYLERKFLDHPLPMLDIWHYWALSMPMNYAAKLTDSGKYLSTTAESVFRFELQKPAFNERHIAWSDVLAEKDILLKVLSRKKPMPIVYHPREFTANIWRMANERLGIDGKIEIADDDRVIKQY